MMITIVDNHLSFFITLQRISKLADFLVNETDAYPCLDFTVIDIQNLGETFQGGIVVAHQLIGHTNAVPCFNIGFIGRKNFFEERDGSFILL